MTHATQTWASPQHRRSVVWIVALATLAIIFDGYDLVVYGTVLPTLMADPTQLGRSPPSRVVPSAPTPHRRHGRCTADRSVR